MNRKLYREPFTQEFKAACRVLSMEKEYPGALKGSGYIIFTELTEEELVRRFPDIMERIRPFVLAGNEVWDAFNEFNKNEYRHSHNAQKHEDIRDDEGSMREFPAEDFVEQIIRDEESEENRSRIHSTLAQMKETERLRLVKYHVEGKKYCEIAREEGVSESAVRQSISHAEKNFRKIFEKDFGFGGPNHIKSRGVNKKADAPEEN